MLARTGVATIERARARTKQEEADRIANAICDAEVGRDPRLK
jgi:hypothetical protein